jgi:hypothetical protein
VAASEFGYLIDLGFGGKFDLFKRVIGLRPHQIAEPEGEAIDDDDIGLGSGLEYGAGEIERLFDSEPVRWAVLLVAGDAATHFIVFGAGGGDVSDARRGTERLSETGFAAAGRADDQGEHYDLPQRHGNRIIEIGT